MINTDNEKEIIPDSLELEVAYWESFKSEWPMQQYRAGVPLYRIAASHYRSLGSLKEFFARKYGKSWRHKKKCSRIDHQHRVVVHDKQIVSLLAEGWCSKQIAQVFGVSVSFVNRKIRHSNLREVAANDTYKPAYAAA